MKKINTGEELLNKLYKSLYLEYNRDTKSRPDERIAKFLSRLENITNEAIKKDKYELLKKMYYNKYIIKEIPDSYYKLQEKIAFEQGHGRIVYNDKMKEEAKTTIINDQKASLDEWLDYLNSDDATYPTWAKYWAFQGMLKIGSYDKENRKFTTRTKTTTNVFIELNREVLALSIDYVQKFIDEETKTDDDKLNKLIENGSFQKIYEYVYNTTVFQKHNFDTNEGIWVKYDRGSDHMPLVKSLIGKGTGWCTAGESTARTQLDNGDFHVYYSKDESGSFTNPRIAIRMEGNSIAEVRGIAKDQHLESSLEDVLDKKMTEFPDKEKYLKKSNDMKLLTKIYEKKQQKEMLTKEDLKFLYELESKIEGFGYKEDPRIAEIKARRSFKKDISYALDCNKDEVSNNSEDLCNGKKLKYYKGIIDDDDIKQQNFKMPEILSGDVSISKLNRELNLTLPTIVNGELSFGGYFDDCVGKIVFPNKLNGNLELEFLKEAESLIFPENLNTYIDLRRLDKVKELVLPSTINGELNLRSLTNTEGLVLPTTVNGCLRLDSVTSPDGLTLPTTVNGNLSLDSLTSAKGLVFPTTLEGSISLDSLTSAEGLILPSTINRDLNLHSLTNAKGLVLPTTINRDLSLRSLTDAEGLILPSTINGELNLSGLTNAEGLFLDCTINRMLTLRNLENVAGLIIGENFQCESIDLGYFGRYFNSDELKEKGMIERIVDIKNEIKKESNKKYK